jgi:hypothetical protein
MGMPRGLAKATNYYNTVEARRDFWRLAKHLAALRAEWKAFQQNAPP